MNNSAATARISIAFAFLLFAAGFGHGRFLDSAKRIRQIRFSNVDWSVKRSSAPVGPGPNFFSDSEKNVFVDQQGQLHLRIISIGGRWSCSEIVSIKSFGYGTYRFELGSVASLPPEAVLGLFTWSDEPSDHHREIDIEVSRWGDPAQPNAQFVVQPYQQAGNRIRFTLPEQSEETSHKFEWAPGRVFFESQTGGNSVQQATILNGIPSAGGENARINLWLYDGEGPPDRHAVEVVVKRFEFVPLQTQR